jgi:hypothetical protein
MKIIFQVGLGKLKLNLNDLREDTPGKLKGLIEICSDYDRTKRLNFVDVSL